MTEYNAYPVFYGVVRFGDGSATNPTVLIGYSEDELRLAAFKVIRSAIANNATTDVNRRWLACNDPFAIGKRDTAAALDWLRRYHGDDTAEHEDSGEATVPGFAVLEPSDVVDLRVRVPQPAL